MCKVWIVNVEGFIFNNTDRDYVIVMQSLVKVVLAAVANLRAATS